MDSSKCLSHRTWSYCDQACWNWTPWTNSYRDRSITNIFCPGSKSWNKTTSSCCSKLAVWPNNLRWRRSLGNTLKSKILSMLSCSLKKSMKFRINLALSRRSILGDWVTLLVFYLFLLSIDSIISNSKINNH